MKALTSNLKWGVILTTTILIISCKKEDPVIPGPPPPETCDTCIYFDGAGINEYVPEVDVTYGDVFYFENGISFRAKHALGSASAVESVPLEGWEIALDPFFSGDKLMTNTNIVQLDFTAKEYDCVHIEFDITTTSDYGPGFFNINGEGIYLPDGVVYLTDPAFGQHVILEGAITTIEWPAGLSYDNLCVTSCDSIYPPPPTEICLDFNESTLESTVELTDTDYGDVVYTMSGVNFRVKYENHLDFDDILDYGIRDLSAAGYTNEHISFEGNGWAFSEVTAQIDLSALDFTSKKVSFDVSNGVIELVNPNEFNVNAAGLGTLPAGIEYNYIDLGPAGNGETCYRIEITGNIMTLEWRGFEIAYDNLCIEEL